MFWKDERITSVPIGDNEFVTVNGKAIDMFWIPGLCIWKLQDTMKEQISSIFQEIISIVDQMNNVTLKMMSSVTLRA